MIPTNLQAIASDSSISLVWRGTSDADHYNIYISTNGGSTYSLNTSSTITQAYVVGLHNGTTYTFVVTSVSIDSSTRISTESTYSNSANATPTAAISPPTDQFGANPLEVLYTTGRTRNITITGNLHMDFPAIGGGNNATIDISFGGPEITKNLNSPLNVNVSTLGNNIELIVCTGASSTGETTSMSYNPTNGSAVNISGTYTITMSVEECVAITTGIPPGTWTQDQKDNFLWHGTFPEYAQGTDGRWLPVTPVYTALPVIKNGPHKRSYRFFERTITGSTVTVSANIGPLTVSQSDTVTNKQTVAISTQNPSQTIFCYRPIVKLGAQKVCNVSATCVLNGTAVQYPWSGIVFVGFDDGTNTGNIGYTTYAYDGTTTSGPALSGVQMFTLPIPSPYNFMYSAPDSNMVYLTISYCDPIVIDLEGRIKNIEGDSPSSPVSLIWEGITQQGASASNVIKGSNPYVLTDASGVISKTTNQKYTILNMTEQPYSGASQGGTLYNFTNATPVSIDESCQARVYISPAWMLTNENSQDSCCLISGLKYDAFSLQHLPSTTINACNSTVGWTGTNATVSLVNGNIQVVAGSSPSSVTINLNTTELNNYRYLNIHGMSVGSSNQSFTLSLHPTGVKLPNGNLMPDKSWNLNTGNDRSPVIMQADLCIPQNISNLGVSYLVDTQNSTYTAGSDGPLWGVTTATSIILSNLQAGTTYVFSAITLDRVDHATLDASYGGNNVGSNPGSGNYTTLFSDVDGKASLEECYNILSAQTSIHDLVSHLQTRVGYTTTLNSTFPLDGYRDQYAPSAWIGGGGATVDQSTGVWTPQYDIDLTLTKTIEAQELFDVVTELYPNIGNPFLGNTGPYGVPFPIRFNKFLRGSSRGVAASDSLLPYSGITIQVDDHTDGTDSGKGTTDIRGEFTTTAPAAKTANSQDIFALKQLLYTENYWEEKRRNRICVLVVPKGGSGPWCYHSKTGQYHFITIKGGNLYYNRSDFSIPVSPNSMPVSNIQVTTSGTAQDPKMIVSHRDQIVLSYQDSLSTFQTVSNDNGLTWNTPTVMFTSAKHPIVVSSPEGTILYAAYVPGATATLQGAIQYPGDPTPSTPFTMTDQTHANIIPSDDTFCISASGDISGRWLLIVILSGQTTESHYVSTDDCKTWSLVTF